jgi:hypothetical protein
MAAPLVLAPACAERESLEEIREEVAANCEEVCPRRVECVADEAFTDIEDCLASCTAEDAAWYAQNECGRAARNKLACAAEVPCDDYWMLSDPELLTDENRPCAAESNAWSACDPDER